MRNRTFAILMALVCTAPMLWADKPTLVVFISVDQLRADLPLKYKNRFGPDGLRRFYDRGTVYTRANYGHVTTYTGCGHATLATGGNPREHGIISNEWYDRVTGKLAYCVSDDDHKLIGAPGAPGGASPKFLLAPTIGDALVDATSGRSHVFSVSGKDRSGVLMGGHKGKAFWYNTVAGTFASSDYYYSALPAWVQDWNDPVPASRYAMSVWCLLRPEAEYVSPDQRDVELPNAIIGGTFPHSLAGLNPAQLYPVLSYTPFPDELVVDFCERLIENEGLGQRGATDLLMVGLSSTDLIGHQFGPESREQEDNLLRLDALLSRFFSYLDVHVGKNNVVLSLSADHGVDGNPDGKPSGQVDEKKMLGDLETALKAKFGAETQYVLGFKEPCIFFTQDVLTKHADALNEIQDAAAEMLATVPGIAYSVPAHKVEDGTVDPANPFAEMLKRSFRKGLSGDVFVLQKEYYRIFSGKQTMTATHGSPYEYDTHVPVLFYGSGIAAQTLDTPVGPESIVATLAAIMGVPAPSGATGPVLQDVVKQP